MHERDCLQERESLGEVESLGKIESLRERSMGMRESMCESARMVKSEHTNVIESLCKRNSIFETESKVKLKIGDKLVDINKSDNINRRERIPEEDRNLN